MIKKFLGYFILLASLYSGACSSDHELMEPVGKEDDEMVDVTFTLTTEVSLDTKGWDTESTLTRAVSAPHQTIGKGKEIDLLVFGVYLMHRDEKQKPSLLSQYGLDYIVNTNMEKLDDVTTNQLKNGALKDIDLSGNLIVMYVGDTFKKNESVTFTIRMMRNQDYCMTYWAQSSKTNAFKISVDKTYEEMIVNVNYDGLNNDEYRDAFCKTDHFSVGSKQITGNNNKRSVMLTRPFAQINVGTTGADYGKKVGREEESKKFTISSITLNGVSNSINLVEDAISTENISVTFNASEIPGTKYKSVFGEEEYLLINLDDHGEDGHFKDKNSLFLPYLETYPTISDSGVPLTETFKYLSMCYVLVPADRANTGSQDSDGNDIFEYTSSVLPEITFTLRAGENGKAYTQTLTNLPVRRNWRTNILKGLAKETTEEDDPKTSVTMNDKTTIFN